MELQFKKQVIIGFAGKRKHSQLEVLNDKLLSLFDAIDKTVADGTICFLNGLADGADQIAARIFLNFFRDRLNNDNSFLAALIPFPQTSYRKTLSSKKNFDDLYACCHQRLELDGKFISGATGDELKEKAYQQQGQVLARMSDLLIAVAPKSSEGKKGSTIETILSALSIKKPVILLNLDDGKFSLYRNIEEWFGSDSIMTPEAIASTLFTQVGSMFFPVLQTTNNKATIYRFRRFAWLLFEHIFKGKPVSRDVSHKKPIVVDPFYNRLSMILDKLDKAAVYFQHQYRGGYILNYGLAILAIFLAVSSLIIYSEEQWVNEQDLPWILAGVGLLKLFVLYTLLVNTKQINNNQYNRNAIDYRYAAERLRINKFISTLGIVRSPFPSLGNHAKKHFANYKGEAIYQGAMAELLTLKFDYSVEKDKLLDSLKIIRDDWIGHQISYHEAETNRMKRMDRHLEHIPEILSKSILLIVAFDLILSSAVEVFDIPLNADFKIVEMVAFPVLLGLTAFIPAIITTLNSIQFQSEAHRLFIRSNLMCEALQEQVSMINTTIQKIENNYDGCDFFDALNTVDHVAAVLTDEVAEWSLIYERRVYDQ